MADISQLLVFVKVVDSKFVASEGRRLLNFNRKTCDIHDALSLLEDNYGGFDKCAVTDSDNTCAMTGNKNGLVALLSVIQCVIHTNVSSTRMCSVDSF